MRHRTYGGVRGRGRETPPTRLKIGLLEVLSFSLECLQKGCKISLPSIKLEGEVKPAPMRHFFLISWVAPTILNRLENKYRELPYV
jgi:hypothetical protein